jgi:hypothetical protein
MTESLYSAMAGLIVVFHLLFVVFAAIGGFLVLRLPVLGWVHLPSAVWAASVELTGRVCPLTPLENALRRRAGLDAYSSDFVARYLFPVLYPDGLTRDAQMLIGAFVIAVNLGIYGWIVKRYAAARARREGPA